MMSRPTGREGETVHPDAPQVAEKGQDALVVDNMDVWFHTPAGSNHAVDDISFALGVGKTMGIVGESGSGKSVLAKSVMRLLPARGVATGGQVLLCGNDISGLGTRKMRKHWGSEVAMVFQDALTALNPVMRVGDQIVEQIREHTPLSRSEAIAKTHRLLTEVGIPSPELRSRQYPHQLSGGMRQRVMIALALSCDPAVLIADEPTTALDVSIQAQIMDLLREEQLGRKMGMVLITHDLGLAANYTDELMVMYGGQVVERGPTKEVLAQPSSPYTEALLRASPRLANPPHTRLETLPGRPPAILGESAGCGFAPRCRRAQERCLVERPRLTLTENGESGHGVRCFYPVGTPGGHEALKINVERGTTAAGLELR